MVRSEGPTPSLDDVDRRNFLGSALALAAAALLPQPVAEPARISTDDVAQCWVSLRRLFELDDRQGGGAVYVMAAGMARHLQDALSRGSYSSSVGTGLGQVTSATMEHAGWLAYDAGRQDDARRWWLETCHLADMAAIPDARVTALASMSLHASTAGRGKEAADLARAARAVAGDRATPTLLSLLPPAKPSVSRRLATRQEPRPQSPRRDAGSTSAAKATSRYGSTSGTRQTSPVTRRACRSHSAAGGPRSQPHGPHSPAPTTRPSRATTRSTPCAWRRCSRRSVTWTRRSTSPPAQCATSSYCEGPDGSAPT